jgi:hypothetical protein
LVLTEATWLAVAAPTDKRCDHSLAHAHTIDGVAGGDDPADEFVPTHVRARDVGVGAVPAVVVAPAQADGEHFHQHPVVRHERHLDVGHSDVATKGGIHGSSHHGESTEMRGWCVIRRGRYRRA